ncbi:hypothetical protein M426DRAFT_268728 [Hypoxylon sp. CI-4A]|nr:hypothetical protein M426DRAFT_268728 [Hypoxylon sp. CI-4A]
MELKCNGGILGDDMGLGKTLSTISLMLARDGQRSSEGYGKTNLVVAPVSLLQQWKREIEEKVLPDHKLRVYMLHNRKASFAELRQYDVVLTSYGMLSSEFNKMDKYITEATSAFQVVNNDDLSRLCPVLGPDNYFYRVILDEAHCIKNHKSKSAKAVCNITALYRWCLTGTPMQNNPRELGSLVHFLRIKPYCDIEMFIKGIGSRSNRAVTKNAMMELQNLLRDILLRRKKDDTIDGRPIIELKGKTEVVDHVVFDPDEQEYYQSLQRDSKVEFNKYLRAGTVGKHYAALLVLILRLRQACCHPYLHIADWESVGSAVDDNSLALAGSLTPDVIEGIKGAEAFVCSVCLDAVESPFIMVPCGDYFCKGCSERLADPGHNNTNAEGDEDGTRMKCPTCQRDENSKVISYDAFKKPRRRQKVTNIEPHTLMKLRKKAVNSERAHRRYMGYLRGIWLPSAKVTKCCQLISSIQKTTQEKIIIFSQWTLLLDLLEVAISDQLRLGLCRYDGNMNATKRDQALHKFIDTPEIKVILVSLKAGNAGLNLTAASQVIIMDPFWNPFVENQAIDRTYRIGQQRDITVHRLLTQDTVEDRIVAIQNRKRVIIDSALGDDVSKSIGRLGTNDLAYLFGVGNKDN